MYDERILGLIDKSIDELVAFAQKLIQTPSITGEEGAIAEIVAEECRKLGLEVETLEAEEGRPNVVARFRGQIGRPCLLAYAHYDTVPPGDLKNWLHHPFSGDIAEGRIWGRGSVDHKSPIACLLWALRALKDVGLEGDIIFTFVGDEEKGGHKGFKFLMERGYGDDADFMIYSVMMDGKEVGIASNGRRYYKITVKGKTAHTALNELGINAIVKAATLITRLQRLVDGVNARTHPLTKRARMSINIINAGVTENNVPDTCEILVDRRITPDETFDQAMAEIQEVINEIERKDPQFEAELTWDADTCMPPSQAPPDSIVTRALQRAGERVLGWTPEIGGVDGSSDHAWFSSIVKRPFAMYGVQAGGLAHSPNESVRIVDLINTTKIYALAMADILGTA